VTINILKKSKPYSPEELFLLFEIYFSGEIVQGIQQTLTLDNFKLIKSDKGKVSLEHSIPPFIRTFSNPFKDTFSNDFFDGFFCLFEKVPLLMRRKSHIAQALIKWRFIIRR